MLSPRLQLVIVLSATVAACSSSHPVRPHDGAPDEPTPTDGTSANDASADRGCVQTSNPGICSPIVRCAPCDGGLCGPISNLDGCDQEGATCTVQGQHSCAGAPCTCSGGFWQCAPLGKACPTLGDSCEYLVNFGGGGASVFYCRNCAGVDGGPTWSAECWETCGGPGTPCCADGGCDDSTLTCIHDASTLDAGICAMSCGGEGLPCCADGNCGALSTVLCVHDSASSATGTCRSCAVLGGPCCSGTIPSRACGIHGLVCDTGAGPEGRCVAGPSDAGSETGD